MAAFCNPRAEFDWLGTFRRESTKCHALALSTGVLSQGRLSGWNKWCVCGGDSVKWASLLCHSLLPTMMTGTLVPYKPSFPQADFLSGICYTIPSSNNSDSDESPLWIVYDDVASSSGTPGMSYRVLVPSEGLSSYFWALSPGIGGDHLEGLIP